MAISTWQLAEFGKTLMHQESPWRLVVTVVVLVFFAAIGVAHVINPDRFIKHTGVRKGGEMLGKWNRDSFRVVGVVFTAVAIYILYELFRRH
jgi:di/tricarboxylate transporter